MLNVMLRLKVTYKRVLNRFFHRCTCAFTNALKDQTGVISLVLVIVLPILMLGCVLAYTNLKDMSEVNKAHKIAFACSEAYLSTHNAFMYDNYGMLVTLDTGTLDKSIQYYFMRNELIDEDQPLESHFTYETLGTPQTFRNVVIDSAQTVVLAEFTTYATSLLNQLEVADKIRGVNQNLQNYEKKLSEQFDQAGATEFLKKINACEDVLTGRKNVESLLDHLDEKIRVFYENYTSIQDEIEKTSKEMVTIKENIDSFLSIKKDDLVALEASFIEQCDAYQSLASELDASYSLIENTQASLDALKEAINQLESGKQSSETKEEINKLQAACTDFEAEISMCYERIKQLTNGFIGNSSTEKPSLVQWLTQMAYEVEALMSGIEIGPDALELSKGLKYSDDDVNFENSNMGIQALIDEYFISIFNSYDLNCPRKIEYNTRHSEKRIIKGELEYLISGISVEKSSISQVRLKIFAIRETANLLTIALDREKIGQISKATIALPQPWRTVAFGAALVGWSSVESYADVNRLMKGEGFYFLKSKEQWKIDFDTLLSGSWKATLNDQPKANDENVKTSLKTKPVLDENKSNKPQSLENIKKAVMDPNLYYLDYLRMLLLLQSESDTILRAMDLMASEIDGMSQKKNNLEDYSRGHTIELNWPKNTMLFKKDEPDAIVIFKNGY